MVIGRLVAAVAAISLGLAGCGQSSTGAGSGASVNPACVPSPTVPSTPTGGEDRRIEDIKFVLTGLRLVGDEGDVAERTNDPNFGGVWGDRHGGVVVAVLDCSQVDADELARIAGGPDQLTLIEVAHTWSQVEAFRDALSEELVAAGVKAELFIDSTVTGRIIRVGALDPTALPDDFGSSAPGAVFTVEQLDSLDSPG